MWNERLGHVDGDGKPDPLPRGIDGGVNANHLPPKVKKRAPGVPWINGGIGLDKIIIRTSTDAPSLGTDNPGCHRVAQAERVPDGEDPVANLELVGVPESRDRQRLVGLDLQHREVGFWISPHDAGIVLALVGQGDGHLFGAVHHMVVGHHIAIVADDDSRPSPLRPEVLRELWHLLEKSLKELAEGPVWIFGPLKRSNLLNLGHFNVDDRWP